MSFLMDLRDDATYTYIFNNLMWESSGFTDYRIDYPRHRVGGDYYYWWWDTSTSNRYLMKNRTSLFAETDPTNQDNNNSWPSHLIPHGPYGYYTCGKGGGVNLKRVDFRDGSVQAIKVYNWTHNGPGENDACVYGNTAVFISAEAENSDGTGNLSYKIIKLELPTETVTELYGEDNASMTAGLTVVSCGLDSSKAYWSIQNYSGDESWEISLSGGARSSNYSDWRPFGWKGYSWGGGVLRLPDASKSWTTNIVETEHGACYLMDDSSYPYYIICSNDTYIYVFKLNSNESVTELESKNIGTMMYRTPSYPIMFRGIPQDGTLFFLGNTSYTHVEIRLPYVDVL